MEFTFDFEMMMVYTFSSYYNKLSDWPLISFIQPSNNIQFESEIEQCE